MKKQPNPTIQLTEQELDTLLQHMEIPGPYPATDFVKQISPWHHSMRLLLRGMIFTSVKLEIWNLNYILPALGSVLMLLALTPLTRESRWFRLAWWGTFGYWIQTGILLFIQGTVWHSHVMESAAGMFFAWSNWIFYLVIYFAPLLGLSQLCRKAGFPPLNKGLLGMMLMAMLLYFTTDHNAASDFIPLLAFAVYFALLLWILRQSFQRMEQAGYQIHSRPRLLSDAWLGAILMGILFLCAVSGMLFCQSYPMHWESTNLQHEHRGQEALMAELIALGMPEHILLDLTAEDVAALAGAKQIIVTQNPLAVKQDMWLVSPAGSLSEEPDLILTIVAVSFSEENRHLQLIHHFHWVKTVPLGRTASVNIQAANASASSGRVLYDQSGETLSSPYHSITAATVDPIIAKPEFWVSAIFSAPRDVTHLRGYLMAESNAFSSALGFTANSHYFFRNQWHAYPAPDVKNALTDYHLLANPTKGFYHTQLYVAGNLDP